MQGHLFCSLLTGRGSIFTHGWCSTCGGNTLTVHRLLQPVQIPFLWKKKYDCSKRKINSIVYLRIKEEYRLAQTVENTVFTKRSDRFLCAQVFIWIVQMIIVWYFIQRLLVLYYSTQQVTQFISLVWFFSFFGGQPSVINRSLLMSTFSLL